jgi:hypothetical protein
MLFFEFGMPEILNIATGSIWKTSKKLSYHPVFFASTY